MLRNLLNVILFSFCLMTLCSCSKPTVVTVVLDDNWVNSIKPGTGRTLYIVDAPDWSAEYPNVAVQSGDKLLFNLDKAMGQELYFERAITTNGRLVAFEGKLGQVLQAKQFTRDHSTYRASIEYIRLK